jgi:flagellar motor switch protein FliN/FliY
MLVGYTVGINGNNILAIQASDASIIADLMMGGDGTNPPEELNEIHMSAVGESMNQMMGTVSTSLSTMFNKKIDISPPKVSLIDFGTEDQVTKLVDQNEPLVKVSFRMEVDGLIDSEIMQILPVDVAKEMVDFLMHTGEDDEPEEAPAPAPAPAAPAPAPTPAPAPQAPPAMAAAPAMMPQAAAMPAYGMQAKVASNVPVQPAQFTPLSSEPVSVNDANIGLILDVPLQVTVELGRTKKSIKEILELSNGSIVELDKLAGEPVDIHVNGKLLAKGEVVVIDENFGVRITDIVSPLERAQKLQ